MKVTCNNFLTGNTNYQDNEVFLLKCCFMDPRFKCLTFNNNENKKQQARSEIKEEMKKIQDNIMKDEEEIFDQCELSTIFGKKLKINNNYSIKIQKDQQIHIEIQRYSLINNLSFESDPLVWWQENHQQFPLLSKQVFKYLSPPATSIPYESLFSKIGILLNNKRNRLSGDKVDKLPLLNTNNKAINN